MKNYDVLRINEALNGEDIKGLKATTQEEFETLWRLKEIKSQLSDIEEIYREREMEIQKEYADDEHSEPTETGRKIKAQYMPEYVGKINMLLNHNNDVNVDKIDHMSFAKMGITFDLLDKLQLILD